MVMHAFVLSRPERPSYCKVRQTRRSPSATAFSKKVATSLSVEDVDAIKSILNYKHSVKLECAQFTEGFCNQVFKVSCGGETFVVKKYSKLSKLRCDLLSCIEMHKTLAERGICPHYISHADDIIVTEYLDGRVLREEDMKELSFCKSTAKLISRLHSVHVEGESFEILKPLLPLTCEGRERALIWKWFHQMLMQLRPLEGGMIAGVGVKELEDEVFKVESFFKSVHLPICFCHGDLKPSNVIYQQDRNFKLIDIDLAGPNYRGFDTMKLFRTTNSFYDESLLSFLQEYQAETNSEMNVEGLFYEAQMCEALTWLEAALFFATLVPMNGETSQRNLSLFEDRWLHYKQTQWKFVYYGKLLKDIG